MTSYQDKTIGQLKKQLRQAVNDLADNLDNDTKQVCESLLRINVNVNCLLLGNLDRERQSV